MRRLSAIVLASAICGFGAGQGRAADLPAKAPAAAAAVVYTWSGFYAGGNVGYGWGKAANDVSFSQLGAIPPGFAIADSVRLKGILGGAQIGYNWQPSRNWVFGLEADWQAADQKAGNTLPPQPYIIIPVTGGAIQTAYDAKIAWFGTVRGRIGYAFDRVLLYATGGLAYGKVKVSGTVTDSGTILGFFPFSATAPFGGSKVNAGWTLGGGIEGAIAGNWTWKIEYLYLDLGSLDTAAAGPFGGETITTHTRFTDNIVRVGLNYRFGGTIR